MEKDKLSPEEVFVELRSELDLILDADASLQALKIKELCSRFNGSGLTRKSIEKTLMELTRQRNESMRNERAETSREVGCLMELPKGVSIPPEFTVRQSGVFKERATKDGIVEERCISAPVFVSGKTTNIDDGTVGVKITFFYDGKEKSILASKKQISIKGELVNLSEYGVPVTSENSSVFVKYLHDQQILSMSGLPEVPSTKKSGWTNYEDSKYFSIGGIVIRPEGGAAIEREISCDITNVLRFVGVTNGQKDEWVRVFKLAKKFPTVFFVFACGITAPLLDLLNVNGFIVHMFGDSTIGKTVATRLALSAFGAPQKGKYLQTWDTTQVGIENRAYELTDLPTPLDDSSLARSKKIIENAVYAFGNGSGRSRGRADGGSRMSKPIRGVGLSNGEGKITDNSSKTGQSVRVLQFNESPFLPQTDTTVDEIRDIESVVQEHYGHFFRPYLECLVKISNDASLSLKLKERHKELTNEIVRSTDNKFLARTAPALGACRVALELAKTVMPSM